MEKPYLTAETMQKGLYWLTQIFIPATKGTSNWASLVKRSNNISFVEVEKAVKELYDFIKNKSFSLNQDFINVLANATYVANRDIAPDINNGETFMLSSTTICAAIAFFCYKSHILWDETGTFPEEINAFKKTPLGEALWENHCFLSQSELTQNELDARANETPNATQKASNAQAQQAQQPQQPQPTAAQQPQSTVGTGVPRKGSTLTINNVTGLVSKQKQFIGTGGFVYWIRSWSNSYSRDLHKLHVSPGSWKINRSTYPKLKVKYTAGQGFDDCVLFFDSLQEAETFRSRADAGKPSSVIQLQVKKVKTSELQDSKNGDFRGFFEVDTEFGHAYIQAYRLNEEVENNNKIVYGTWTAPKTTLEEDKDNNYYAEAVKKLTSIDFE